MLIKEEIKIGRRAQSTLEYVIILAAIVGGIIVVAALLKPRIQGSYDHLDAQLKAKMVYTK